ncbi:cobalt-precorrin 5A hydrolase [Ruegeria halocynthiae]|uniref:Cobalt-precorrin 5A hydrolase n=1 Tax=Ruegeria halocynthiae TaxID=985054 RepID=A0A1H2UUZ6_9RHOB|nr:cobalamin biosynthesis protein [Ruegeria halocynthiae]SDW59798.1 cobalt-precorrin 5A hydrolase [Ruegeria halocynthiae]
MIVAGFGFSSSATLASLRSALELATDGQTPDALATVADKDGHTAITTLADSISVPVHFIPADDLAGHRTLTCSPRSRATYGTGSVAEASALAAAGPGARLISPRQISDDRLATCAVAIGGHS